MDSFLKPETSISYDAGLYRRIGQNLDMRIAVNYINTSNYYVTNTTSPYYSGSYAYQIEGVKFYGTELEFNWKATEKLIFFGNYSYQNNAYSLGEEFPYPMLLNLPPKNKGKLSIRYTLPFKTRLSSDVIIYGERLSEGGYTLDGYATADLSLERNFAGRMMASFYINNLTGTEYQQVYGYPSPGVTWGVRLKISTARNIFSQ
jgi:vitamin B12 transporter